MNLPRYDLLLALTISPLLPLMNFGYTRLFLEHNIVSRCGSNHMSRLTGPQKDVYPRKLRQGQVLEWEA